MERLTANWMLLAPYVTKPNGNQTDNVPGGLVSPFVNEMAVTCCQSCKTHGESYIDYELNGMGEAALKKSEDVFRRCVCIHITCDHAYWHGLPSFYKVLQFRIWLVLIFFYTVFPTDPYMTSRLLTKMAGGELNTWGV